MRIFLYPFVFILGFWLMSVQAASPGKELPDEMLKRVTQEMVTALRQDKNLQDHPEQIYPIIDKLLVPHVDWMSMSKWVVGRNAWLKATKQEQQKFSNEFRDLLIRTYASTLGAYNNQTIEYVPIRGGVDGKSRVHIVSYIREPGKEPIKVGYRLVDQGPSWKVYDISIEGVSLLKGFQSQFSEELQQNGIGALIERLHAHNEKPIR